MRFIENQDLREWVKESLQRAVFQKAHELAVQTGCEVLVKLQDMADHSGQYYATRTLHLQYQGKGLSKQPWDIKVSGVTGLPEAIFVEKGCQSEGALVPGEDNFKVEDEDRMITESDIQLMEQHTDINACENHQASQCESEIDATQRYSQVCGEGQLDSIPTNIKEEQEPDLYEESFQSSDQPAYSNLDRDQEPSASEEINQTHFEDCGNTEALPTMLSLRTNTAYPIGFPINKLQLLTKSVNDMIQTPFPSQVLSDSAQDLSETMPSASNTEVVPAVKPYQCGICLKRFGSIQILSRHAQMNHGMDRRMSFLCDVCGQSYKQAQHLQRHMRMHQTVMPYICSVCNKGFFNGTSLVKHEKAHKQLNERHQCRACLKFFAQITDLQEHFRQVHGGPGIKSSSHRLIQSEMPSSEATEPPACDTVEDGDVHVEPSSQNIPFLPGPSTARPVFSQNMPNITSAKSNSASPSSSEEQNQDKEGSPQMSWQDMTSSFADSEGSTPTSSVVSIPGGIQQPLLRHVSQFPAGSQPSIPFRFNRHVCHLCGKSYKYNFTLKEHLLTHSSVPQFICKICGTAFTRQRLLRDHMFRHSGTYPYHCELCGKGFIRPSTMKRHQTDRHRLLHNVAD